MGGGLSNSGKNKLQTTFFFVWFAWFAVSLSGR
jgi:hypothetical protein